MFDIFIPMSVNWMSNHWLSYFGVIRSDSDHCTSSHFSLGVRGLPFWYDKAVEQRSLSILAPPLGVMGKRSVIWTAGLVRRQLECCSRTGPSATNWCNLCKEAGRWLGSAIEQLGPCRSPEPPCPKEPTELVWVSVQDALWTPPLEVLRAHPTRRSPCNGVRTHWKDYISHLVWEQLRIPQGQLGGVAGEGDVWNTLLILLPLPPDPPDPSIMDGRIECQWLVMFEYQHYQTNTN